MPRRGLQSVEFVVFPAERTGSNGAVRFGFGRCACIFRLSAGQIPIATAAPVPVLPSAFHFAIVLADSNSISAFAASKSRFQPVLMPSRTSPMLASTTCLRKMFGTLHFTFAHALWTTRKPAIDVVCCPMLTVVGVRHWAGPIVIKPSANQVIRRTVNPAWFRMV
jgi:hypothetical protein